MTSEHLVMKHLIFQCERCMEVFQDQVTLNNHFRSLRSCELAPATCQDDGITKATMEKLKSKKKRYLNKAADHRWKEMFLLLFPDADVPSPCKFTALHGLTSSTTLGFKLTLCRFRANTRRLYDERIQWLQGPW
jgi:hypothetical protein